MSVRIQSFSANTVGRDFVVGDIHGCFYLLEAMLARIGFEPMRDRLFSVGDLIDRGPDSERAGEFLDASWFFAIRGNHEQMLLDAVTQGTRQADARQLWRLNGGDWFEGLDKGQRAALADRVAALPYALEIGLAHGGLAGVIHADVAEHDWPATRSRLADDTAGSVSEFVWSRERAYVMQTQCNGGDTRGPVAVSGIDWVAFGHTPLSAPVACANTRWLDTGAVHGNCLSIAELAIDGQVWSLSADGEALEQGWRQC